MVGGQVGKWALEMFNEGHLQARRAEDAWILSVNGQRWGPSEFYRYPETLTGGKSSVYILYHQIIS